ncbi:MAG: tetratricopeptide repeat protein [Bacteroidales bacterium]|nr:tetratricopeptide repeat protein [Bacteroidales bacterium]
MANTEINENENQDQLENVELSLGRTEQYIEKNKEKIFMGIGIVVAVILGIMAYSKLIKTPRENKAASQMFMAEQYFERDSFNLALNGDNNGYPGFLGIIKEYSGTKAANNAKYYAGVCYMNLGDFDGAIRQLEDFSSSDPMLEPVSIGLLGDAYMEKGMADKAQGYYQKAIAKAQNNNFIAPVYLQKLGISYEAAQKYQDALNVYEKIKTDYPASNEARTADKFIEAMKLKLGK